jgi:hypothetical protein
MLSSDIFQADDPEQADVISLPSTSDENANTPSLSERSADAVATPARPRRSGQANCRFQISSSFQAFCTLTDMMLPRSRKHASVVSAKKRNFGKPCIEMETRW